jgi:hypothetical protein
MSTEILYFFMIFWANGWVTGWLWSTEEKLVLVDPEVSRLI